jgi:hypothetical protein
MEVFRDLKHRVINICLTAVQEVIQPIERGNSRHLILFSPQDKPAVLNAKRNIKGLLMHHSLIVNDPWQAADDLPSRNEILAETKTLLVQRAHYTINGINMMQTKPECS